MSPTLSQLAVMALFSCVLIGILDSAFARHYAIKPEVRRFFLVGFGGACTTIPRVAIGLMNQPGGTAHHLLMIGGATLLGFCFLQFGEILGKLF